MRLKPSPRRWPAASVPQARNAAIAAAAVGLVAVVVLYRAADLGGQLVYGYGGGVGIRSGDPQDVNRVFIAGAHHQAAQDRASGRPLDAAALSDLVAARFPDDLEVQLGRIESTLVDRGDPQTALEPPQRPERSAGRRPLRGIRAGLLRARALLAMNDRSAARQVLETLRTEFPADQRIQEQLAEVSRP